MLSDLEIDEIEKLPGAKGYRPMKSHIVSLIATIRELKSEGYQHLTYKEIKGYQHLTYKEINGLIATIRELKAQNDRLIKQREKYREALECYVNCPYWLDEGKKAREALKDERL